MNHKHRRFNEEDDGFRETIQYYKSRFGKPYLDVYKETVAQVDPASQDDGTTVPSLEASCWAFTDDMNIPSTGEPQGNGPFYATAQPDDIVSRDSCSFPKVSMPLLTRYLWSVGGQSGYIIGCEATDHQSAAVQQAIVNLEPLLRLAWYRLQCKGYNCKDVLQAVVYCFVGSPECSTEEGASVGPIDSTALSVGHFIKEHQTALPLCFRMWQHGSVLFKHDTASSYGPHRSREVCDHDAAEDKEHTLRHDRGSEAGRQRTIVASPRRSLVSEQKTPLQRIVDCYGALVETKRQLDLCQRILGDALYDRDEERITKARIMTELKLIRQHWLERELVILQREASEVEQGWGLNMVS